MRSFHVTKKSGIDTACESLNLTETALKVSFQPTYEKCNSSMHARTFSFAKVQKSCACPATNL